MFNSTNISPTREFPQPLIIAYGFCGPYVCTVRQTVRPHRQASLIRFSVLSTHLFTSREQWQRIAKCQYTGKICASFFSLFVYLCLPLCMSNSWAPNTTSHCAPPPAASMRPTVGLLADIQQSISFVRGPASLTSQEADRNTQTRYSPHFFLQLCK